MAGEDQLTLSNGTVETMTIIPANGKLQANGNGLHKQQEQQQPTGQHNNNGSLDAPNCKELELENGKLVASMDEKSNSFQTDFDDDETTCGWGPFRPKWLQRLATKQMFLVIFCITWVSSFNLYRVVEIYALIGTSQY